MKIILLVTVALCSWRNGRAAAPVSDYAVVVSAATAQDAGWAKVVAALKHKHRATIVTVKDPCGAESRDQLRQLQPRYVAFVAQPEEVGVEFVRQVHLLARTMDEDPYADFQWGIITAATPAAARRIATATKPLIVRRALTTTGIQAGPLDACLTLSDGRAGDFMLKENGKTIHGTRTNDSIAAHERFLKYYNHNEVDLLVTSSHSTEANLEMPFSEGAIVISGARMFMVNRAGLYSFVRAASGNAGSGLWYQSPAGAARRAEWAQQTTAPELRQALNPKIYIAAGNCLIGDVMNTADSLVIDWLTYQGVNQFVGYTVPTWFGKGGWGTLELWQDSGGQRTLGEAFFLNNQLIVHKLVTDFPAAAGLALDAESLNQVTGERRGSPTPTALKLRDILKNTEAKQRKELLGYLYDRDVVAFYGDPKWEARLARAQTPPPVTWTWSGQPGRRVLELNCAKDFKKDALAILLPERVKNGQVTAAAAGLSPFLNDEFILFSNVELTAGKTYRLEITAARGRD